MRVLIFVLIVLNFIGCKETHCPAFPANLVEFFPYSNGDELKFINVNNDTLKLKIIKNQTSDSYSYSWNCKCTCGADAGFETDFSINYPLKIVGNINIGKNNFERICDFYDSTIHNDVLSYLKGGINPFSEEQQPNLADTIFIETQTNNRIRNTIIVKGKGIVEFWDKKQNSKWIMIE